MIYFCCDELRREAVKKHDTLNGIDFLEVQDDPKLSFEERQRTLFIHFLNENHLGDLKKENLHIEGGERVRDVTVTGLNPGPGAKVLSAQVDKPGDFSLYTLLLVKEKNSGQPPPFFAPILSAVEFSFKANCPSDFDCLKGTVCPTEPGRQPDINYLAKDYGSFRQLMLDRLALLMPQWKERNPADLGVALVELLAYVGDSLSYQQDAVATEAYLGTARRRVSVRRHARLVDYFLHEGCNGRAWVQVQVGADNVGLEKGTPILTSVEGQRTSIRPDSPAYQEAMARKPEIFETLHEAILCEAHNGMPFYTWGDERCFLPKGATRATLLDNKTHRLRILKGDVLIFEEVRDPREGNPADADPARRHAVRLTGVTPEATLKDGKREASAEILADPLNGQAIVEIEWDQADALPFSFCLWNVKDKEGEEHPVSLARGNIVLADHGRTLPEEDLGIVPPPKVLRGVPGGDPCGAPEIQTIPARFRPQLKEGPLTHAGPYDPKASAHAAMNWTPREALPRIELTSKSGGQETATWQPKRDHLGSKPDAHEFVVETESDGAAYLRFGDDEHGRRPEKDMVFSALYRIGNGIQGNVGAETLTHIVTEEADITGVRNPLPARGGLEPESMEEVRESAPSAFRTQERAVTAEDYAAMAERHSGVQRAAATFRWTGSWRTVFVTVDRWGGLPVDDSFKNAMRDHLEPYRLAGHDVEVDGPLYVSLEVEMRVCVKPDYFQSDVKAALLQVFSNRVLPDGRRGVFHPDNFSFGQTVYLSPLYAAAQAVAGVASLQIIKFQRLGTDSAEALETGKLALGRLEIARLDNDPNFQEHGIFRLFMEGGK